MENQDISMSFKNFFLITFFIILYVFFNSARPDLEEARQQLIVETAANKKALQELEDKILFTLAQSEGSNILENEEATEVLDSSKYLVDDIKSKQKVIFRYLTVKYYLLCTCNIIIFFPRFMFQNCGKGVQISKQLLQL